MMIQNYIPGANSNKKICKIPSITDYSYNRSVQRACLICHIFPVALWHKLDTLYHNQAYHNQAWLNID